MQTDGAKHEGDVLPKAMRGCVTSNGVDKTPQWRLSQFSIASSRIFPR